MYNTVNCVCYNKQYSVSLYNKKSKADLSPDTADSLHNPRTRAVGHLAEAALPRSGLKFLKPKYQIN